MIRSRAARNFAAIPLALALLSTSSCRFGNRVEVGQDPDTYSGYYETQAQTLAFCAVKGPSSDTVCASQATNLVPAEIATVFTNPLAFIAKDLQAGDGYFVGLSAGNPSLQIFFNPDRTLSFVGSSSPAVAWIDPVCTTRIYLEEEGSLTQAGPYSSGASVKLSGRLNLTLSFIRSFDGDCAPTLKSMYDCYLQTNQCPGSSTAEQEEWRDQARFYFDDTIRSGAMVSADIQAVSRLGYEVVYQ